MFQEARDIRKENANLPARFWESRDDHSIRRALARNGGRKVVASRGPGALGHLDRNPLTFEHLSVQS